MSQQFIVLEIVLAWDAYPSRVPKITSLMTHFLASEKDYAIPFQFVIMLASLIASSPKSWRKFGWHKFFLMALFQDFTKKLSGLLYTHFLASFFSMGMISIFVPLSLMMVA
jgi:hypothetical protein